VRAKEALWALSDRLWFAQMQEYMVIDWLMAVLPDDFPQDRRYLAAKERMEVLRMVQREANTMASWL
jgi:hypothetical protein